jgi:hypothetical protein
MSTATPSMNRREHPDDLPRRPDGNAATREATSTERSRARKAGRSRHDRRMKPSTAPQNRSRSVNVV